MGRAHSKRYLPDGTATTLRVDYVTLTHADDVCAVYAVFTSWAGGTTPKRRLDACVFNDAEDQVWLGTWGTSRGPGWIDRETPQFRAGIRTRVRNAERERAAIATSITEGEDHQS